MNLNTKNLFNLKGKIAIITGGAGMLGQKHAEAVAEFGGNPVLLDIINDKGKQIAKSLSRKYNVKSEYFQCDITNEKQICNTKDSIIKIYNQIDILINNAALDPKVGNVNVKNSSKLEQFSAEQWNMELSVGLTGAMLCSKVFGKEMVKIGKGVIVNISSDLGIIAPDQRIYKDSNNSREDQFVKPVTYSVLKHGIIGLTKYIATYWADKGIRCNALCPGGIIENQSEEFLNKISDLIPLGRMAERNEYKSALIFLVSDASSYMTGSNLVIDGGRTCW